eukprot:8599045-Alexandrium_andersonii.AAC.1
MAGEEERTATASVPSGGERALTPEAPAEIPLTPATPLTAPTPPTAATPAPPGTGGSSGVAE